MEKDLEFAQSGGDLPPQILTVRTDAAIAPGKESRIQTVISWDTNEQSTGRVYYQKGINTDPMATFNLTTPLNANYTREHVVLLPSLEPGEVYSFQIESIDSSGNFTRTKTYTLLTPREKEGVLQVIIKQMEETFGWVGNMRNLIFMKQSILQYWPLAHYLHHESLGERAKGGVALCVSTIVGSTFNAFAKSLSGTLSSLSLLFVSELLTAIFIFFSFGIVPTIKSILRFNRQQIGWLLVLAILTSIIGPLLLFSGITLTSAINVGFFGKMQIIFLLILARFILKETMTAAHILAMTSVIIGISIIMLKGFTQSLSLQWGDILIIASALSYALGNIVFRVKLHKVDSHLTLIFRSGIAVSTFFIVSPFLTHPFIAEIRSMPLSVIPSLIGFAFFARFLSNITYYAALDRLHVTTVSLVSSLDIIGATFFAYLYLGETIAWYHYVGGAFVLLGTILLNIFGTHPTEKHLEDHLKQNI